MEHALVINICKFLLASLVGAGFGTLLFVGLAQMSGKWKLGGLSSTALGLTGYVFFKVPELGSKMEILIHTSMVISTSATFCLLLINFVNTLRRSFPGFPISTTLILASNEKLADQFVDIADKKSNLTLKSVKLKKIHASINNRLAKVKQREGKVSKKEVDLESKSRSLSNRVKKGFHIELPYNREIPISSELISTIPMYVKSLVDFSYEVYEQMEKLTNFIPPHYTISQRIHNYLRVIALNTTILVGSKGVRIHFRYRNGNFYRGFYTFPPEEAKKDITPMPVERITMITAALASQRAVVKSVNNDYHHSSENDSRWIDYMTLAFIDTEQTSNKRRLPYITMGISLTYNSTEQINCLRFLSYTYFEYVVEGFIKYIDEQIHMKEYISKLSSKEH